MVLGIVRYAVVFFTLFLGGCAYVNVSLTPSVVPLKEMVVEGKGEPKILMLNISGFISERGRSDRLKLQQSPSLVEEVRETLKKAEEDDVIAGIIIKINSPGGTVSASNIIYHELMNFRKKKGVPVYACITGVGTSGAYYIAAASDKIYSHPSAIIGSIGVIAMKFNAEGLMTKLGIEDETIKSGAKKDMFSPFRPLTTEERNILQGVIDDLHNQFVNAVFDQRRKGMTLEELNTLADGRIYTAGTALELRLIDHVGYMDEVIMQMKEKLGIENARVVRYRRGGKYAGTIYSSSPAHDTSLMDLVGDYTDGQALIPGISFLYIWNP